MSEKKFEIKKYIPSVVFFVLGIASLVIKTFSNEYFDEQGILHENFYLIPVGFFFIGIAVTLFIITAIFLVMKKSKKS